jgi:pimeloyl-ACP methyl ester carboxylesterase
MAPIARGLSDACRILEPFQRKSDDERLTVARHVADLHEIINFHTADFRPALLGASWGAMLALAYAAAHPSMVGPLILVGCGTFDLVARAELHRIIAERMTDVIRARLKGAERLDPNARLKASADATTPIYSYDPLISPHKEDEVDARAHHETWDDIVASTERRHLSCRIRSDQNPCPDGARDVRPASGPPDCERFAAVFTSTRLPGIGALRSLSMAGKSGS